MKISSLKSLLCYLFLLMTVAFSVCVVVGLAMKNFNLCMASVFGGYFSVFIMFSCIFGIKDKENTNG